MHLVVFAGLPYSGMNAAARNFHEKYGYARLENEPHLAEPARHGLGAPATFKSLTAIRELHNQLGLGDEEFLANLRRGVCNTRNDTGIVAATWDYGSFDFLKRNFRSVYPVWIDATHEERHRRYLEGMHDPRRVLTKIEYALLDAAEIARLGSMEIRESMGEDARVVYNHGTLGTFHNELRRMHDLVSVNGGSAQLVS